MRLRSALLLATLLVPAVPGAEPVGETHPWNLLDCEYVYVVTPALASRVAPHLPRNFRPAIIERVQGQALTQLAFEMETCAEGSGLDGQVRPMTYAQSSVPALPPPHLNPGADLGVYVKFHPLIPDGDRRAHFVARGVPAYGGDVEIGADFSATLPGRFQATTRYDTLGSYAFDLVAAAPDVPAGGEFTQYLGGTDGSLSYWRTNWSAPVVFRTAGTVTLPEGSLEADILGATTVPVRGSSGVWSYVPGKVVLPP